jgi:thiamine-phosphate pyrophosphorylase
MSRRVPELSVYLVTDRLLARGRELVDVVLAAVRGGATVVQLREKEGSARETLALGRALLERLRPLGVPLIVNASALVRAVREGLRARMERNRFRPGT